jgi:hypothetical protein
LGGFVHNLAPRLVGEELGEPPLRLARVDRAVFWPAVEEAEDPFQVAGGGGGGQAVSPPGESGAARGCDGGGRRMVGHEGMNLGGDLNASAEEDQGGVQREDLCTGVAADGRLKYHADREDCESPRVVAGECTREPGTGGCAGSCGAARSDPDPGGVSRRGRDTRGEEAGVPSGRWGHRSRRLRKSRHVESAPHVDVGVREAIAADRERGEVGRGLRGAIIHRAERRLLFGIQRPAAPVA